MCSATIDAATLLHYTAKQYFIDEIRIHENNSFIDTDLPIHYHLLIRSAYRELGKIIDWALGQIPQEQHARFE